MDDDSLDIIFMTSSSDEEEDHNINLEDAISVLKDDLDSTKTSERIESVPSRPEVRVWGEKLSDVRSVRKMKVRIAEAARVAMSAHEHVSRSLEALSAYLRKRRAEMRKKRDLAVKELVETERSHALRMKFVIDVLRPLLTKDQRTKLGLVDLATLVPLSERIASIDTKVPGQLFDRFYAESIKMYRDYCVQQPVAASLVKKWIKKRPNMFKDYETRVFGAEKDLPPRMYGTNLLSALMQPVQRVMRYGMLLKAILKAEHRREERNNLKRAIEKIESTCKEIDSQMQRPRLERLYASIEELRPGTIRPKRSPLLVHNCILYGESVCIILFNDLVVLGKISDCETILHRVVRYVPFKLCRLMALHDDVSLRVLTETDRFTLNFEEEVEREKFLKSCRENVSDDIESITDLYKHDTFEINTIQIPRYDTDAKGTFYYEIHIVPRGTIVREYERECQIRGIILNTLTERTLSGRMSSSGHGWITYIRFNQVKQFIRTLGGVSDAPRYEGRLTTFSSNASVVARVRKHRVSDFLDACASHDKVRNMSSFRELIRKRPCPFVVTSTMDGDEFDDEGYAGEDDEHDLTVSF